MKKTTAKGSIYRATDASIARKAANAKPKRPKSGSENLRFASGVFPSFESELTAMGGRVYDPRTAYRGESRKYSEVFPGKNDAKKRGR